MNETAFSIQRIVDFQKTELSEFGIRRENGSNIMLHENRRQMSIGNKVSANRQSSGDFGASFQEPHFSDKVLTCGSFNKEAMFRNALFGVSGRAKMLGWVEMRK